MRLCLIGALVFGWAGAAVAQRPISPAPVASTLVHGDTTLLSPTLLLATHDTLIVFDQGDLSLKVLTQDGRLLRKIGRQGSGPGEFQHPVAIVRSTDGSIVLADEALSRLTWYAIDGKLVRTVALPETPSKVVALAGGQIAVSGRDPLTFSVYAPTGKIAGKFELHVGDSRRTPLEASLVYETATASDRRGSAIVAFRWSPLVVEVSSSGQQKLLRQAAGNFPRIVREKVANTKLVSSRIDPSASEYTWAAAVDRRRVFTLSHETAGSTTIHELDREAPNQWSEFTVPLEAEAIAATDGFLCLLVSDPLPAVYTYRLW
ncbi:MAG TPA: 6-bladed beta-propeller [Gemmatimonadales bacterium]|nr:6-bladed beta-propeller [Gemmatimonadales bacterium]